MKLRFDLQIGSALSTVECVRPKCTVGRSLDCDIVIDGDERRLASVAPQHFRIECVDRQPMIQDLQSSHGTWVNGKSVVTPVRLKLGDRIACGRLGPTLTLRLFEPEAAPAPAAPIPTLAAPPRPAAPVSTTPAQGRGKWLAGGVAALLVVGVIGMVIMKADRLDQAQPSADEPAKVQVPAGGSVTVASGESPANASPLNLAASTNLPSQSTTSGAAEAPLVTKNERGSSNSAAPTAETRIDPKPEAPKKTTEPASGKLEDEALPATPPKPLPGHYALLIGVRLYGGSTGLRPLQFAESDVEELRSTLVKRIGYLPENVHVLSKSEEAREQDSELSPTRSNVMNRLARILKDRKPDDSVLVAFAGHGLQFKGSDDFFFCPSDAAMAADGDTFDRRTLLSQAEIYKALKSSSAGVKLLISDACRNDPISGSTRARMTLDLESVTRPQSAIPPQDVAAIFSCSEKETAHEDDKLGHGVFFHFFIKGIRGEADANRDGVITIRELDDFAAPKVSNYVLQRFAKSQTPQFKSDLQRRDAALFRR